VISCTYFVPNVSPGDSPPRIKIRFQGPLTFELAYNSNPPIGANMTLIAKNSGRTVFGVRIGLRSFVSSSCAVLQTIPLTARPSAVVDETQYL